MGSWVHVNCESSDNLKKALFIMKFVLTGISFVLALIVSDPVMAGRKVIYPNVNGAGKSSFGYSVLKLALENSGQEAELEVLDSVVNNDRIRCMIKSGRISISDFGTSIEYERDLRPIHFPIDMGLNG